MSYLPDKGDIMWLEFNPQAGKEQAGHRPCLVLSPKLYNQFGLCVVCPIISVTKGYRWEVALDENLDTDGNVLSDQVKNLDWKTRNAIFKEKADSHLVDMVLERINVLLFSG